MDIELFSSISKYPFVHENGFFNSKDLNQNKTCFDKCKEKDCVTFLNDNTENGLEYVCSKGYNNYLISFSDFKCVLNGLIFENNKTVPIGRKEVRKEWFVSKSEIVSFVEKLFEIEKHIE